MSHAAAMEVRQVARPDADATWVLEALEPDQLVTEKARRFGLRRLGRGTKLLMWALRGYVVFMLVVVVYQVVQGSH